MGTPATPVSGAAAVTQEFKEFAYIVSHDLSAPLRAVVEFSKLLKNEHTDGLNEEGQLYLSMVIESGQKLQQMLAGLLDYSRLNTMSKPPAKVNCNTILNDCKLVLKDRINDSNAKIEIVSLPTVMADPEQLMQLFLMLLQNALTFHVAGTAPHIKISAQAKGQEWEFTVQDNGIGIEEEFHSRIFKPFQRLHGEKEYPGLGMGLALAKKIVDRHGGRLWVDSSFGQGASFIFTLPRNEGE